MAQQMSLGRIVLALGIGMGSGAAPGAASAASVEIGPSDNLIASVAALGPGDELVLRGGTYSLSPRFAITVSGAAGSPIVIRAKAGEVPVITRPDANQNTINIEDARHVTLRGLEVTGGSHGIRIARSSFITIEDCHVHHTDDVAISANVTGSSYEGLRFVGNHVHDTSGTGEGFYLGCNNDACRMFNSVIERNWIHDTINGTSQGDGIEIKLGSYANLVRDNVIHDTRYPCILVYGVAGHGGPNVIERNAMWGCGDHGIQAAADAVIRNNIVIRAAVDGIKNQLHQGASPSNLVIVHNTVIASGANSAIRSDGVTGSVLIANNAVYSEGGSAIRVAGALGGVTVAGNVGRGGVQGVAGGFTAGGALSADFVDASFSSSARRDVFPRMGSALIGAAAAVHLAADDFNGTARSGALDVGAYRYAAGGNPGWAVIEGFKDAPQDPPVGDAGVAPVDAGGTVADAGGAVADAGGPVADVGPVVQPDASTQADAGSASFADATAPGADAGAAPADAGSAAAADASPAMVRDAGSSGPREDAAMYSTPAGEVGDGSCGCTSADSGVASTWSFAALILALAATRRRRR